MGFTLNQHEQEKQIKRLQQKEDHDTTDYESLDNLPEINSVELKGNKSLSDLGIQAELTFDDVPTNGSDNPVTSGGVYDADNGIYEVMGRMGAKNLIPYPGTETTKTENGITFTDNGDGTVTVVTDAGGATADTAFYFCKRQLRDVNIPKGKYMLTGCPAAGSNTTYFMFLNSYVKGTTTGGMGLRDEGDGATAESTYDLDIGVYIQIRSGFVTTTPLVFKPMLRLASDTDPTYQPYAKTNKQLTDDIKALSGGGITYVTATAGTGDSPNAVKLCDYPTGFTLANTMVLGAQTTMSNGDILTWNGMSQYSAVWYITLKSDGIYGIWNANDINGQPIRIALAKIPST